MINRSLAALFLLVLALSAPAGAGWSPMPESDAVPGWEREGAMRRFTSSDLYGHINGGAELFLELGFKELLVQPYRNGDKEVALEVYRMGGPLAALAIYLFKCGEESPWPEIDARNSSTRFQATLLQGDCFVLVNSFSGDRSLRPVMVGLAGTLLEAIPEADHGDPFGVLPTDGRVPGSERLIRGEYSLQALYTLGPGDVLQLGGKRFGVAADYRAGEGQPLVTRIQIHYPMVTDAAAAYANLSKLLDPTLELLEQGEDRLLFRDYAGRFGLVRQSGELIKISVNIAERP